MPVNARLHAYLITDYRYHWICTKCRTVTHLRAGATPDDCACGNGCYTTLLITPECAQPAYIQRLAHGCAACRKTLAEINRLDAQMVLFEEPSQ